MELKIELKNLAKKAQEASRRLASIASSEKNLALRRMAQNLLRQKNAILKGNKKDIDLAVRAGLSRAFIDRLTLGENRIKEMADSLLAIARLPDPVGMVLKQWKRPNGLLIRRVRTPIGVIAIIYESRPNVTSDCAGLTFKSGNSVILRGGSESLNSNIAIYKALISALRGSVVPEGVINLITTPNRKAVDILLGLNDYIDLVMPRGGEALIRRVVELSRIPVIKHYKGICHIYVDKAADLDMAFKICLNAKVQRPGVCNAMESMLVHKAVAAKFLPEMARRFKKAGVELRGCPVTCKLVKPCRRATENDYRTEYLDLRLSVKVVKDVRQAIEHINYYGSHHSDTIITGNAKAADEFLKKVDSACVYLNASTRFTDGHQFGMGAEIGISTDKLHARGPMGLEELTTYKYTVLGNGQIRE
ncbi:MAG: glutamate-5-semialdehyde dehydrogenase [Candidatus Omnitrophica bacterium]|nr:glutamate-5-semialdehyde dehydrogenase [Candidatus Omnitrophota bacterium]